MTEDVDVNPAAWGAAIPYSGAFFDVIGGYAGVPRTTGFRLNKSQGSPQPHHPDQSRPFPTSPHEQQRLALRLRLAQKAKRK
jgi:hypothetical protein